MAVVSEPTVADRRRWLAQDGNTLVLMPAAVLILLGLAAMALDTATLFLGERRLVDVTSSIAHDAVASVDEARFYDPEIDTVELDAARVGVRAQQLLAAQRQDRTFEDVRCDPPDLDGPRVTITCHATVRPPFAPFWGLSDRHRLSVSETAVGVRN